MDKNSLPVLLLGIVIFSVSIITDHLIPNSLLSIPLLISSSIAILILRWGIPKIKSLELNQIIREEGPESHKTKAGTPSMGGLLAVPIGLIIGCLVSVYGTSRSELIAISCLTLSFMMIGIFDDLQGFSRKTNKGLSVKAKFILQCLFGIIFLYWANSVDAISSSISLPMGFSFNLGIWIWPLSLFVIIAESNASNLTDGLDGLASGCATLIFSGIAVQLMLRGNEGDPAIAGFSMAMAGAWLGFLVYNRFPAKIFMGDTGSLAIGAGLSGIALISDSLFALLIMGGLFLIESLSVIIQVVGYKLTKEMNGKGIRIFRMAPLHHHFEIGGINEKTIVQTCWLITGSLILSTIILITNS